jgi:ABC-type uncharacterized transport system ATPase subunit
MTIEMPAHAVEKLMDGYRRRDPLLMALLNEFHVLAIQPHDEQALAVWEYEGGK